MKRLIVLIITNFIPILIFAQALQHEKVLFAPNKTNYSINDTIQIYGMLLNEYNKPEVYSNYVYFDVINQSDSIISHQVVQRNENGTFSVEYITEPDCKPGLYYLRAYSRFMLNFNSINIPVVPITINKTLSTNDSNSLECYFFPEGKNFGNGFIQRVGVHITTKNGKTEPVAFTITDGNGTELVTSTTTESGWQTISVMPNIGKELYLNTNHKGNKQTFMMPPATDKETIRLIPGKKSLNYELHGLKGNKEYSLFLYTPSLGLSKIPTVSEHGSCLVDENLKGAVTLILTDNKGNVLTETSAWQDYSVDNVQKDDVISLKTYYPCETPQFMMTSAEQQIYFGNDFDSPVPFPSATFLKDKKGRQQDITPWLFSTTFSRLNIKEATKGYFLYNIVPETKLHIGGIVKVSKNKTLKRGEVIALSLDNGIAEKAEIDKDGRFKIELSDFPNGDTFFLRAKEYENDNTNYQIIMDVDSLPSFDSNKILATSLLFDKEEKDYETEDYDHLLSEVNVTAKHIRVKYNKDERYFKHRYIDSEDIEKYNMYNLRHIIQSFFNIYMRIMENKYLFTNRPSILRQATMDEEDSYIDDTFLFPNEIPAVLDGIQMHLFEAEGQCSINDIVSIEYLSPTQTLAEPGCSGCINGALVIKTGKKTSRPQERKGIYYTPTGLSYSKFNSKTLTPTIPGEYFEFTNNIDSSGNIVTKARIITVKQ